MKNRLVLVLVVLSFAFASCRKCYTCETGATKQEYCKGSVQYEQIKATGGYIDDQGNNLSCL